MYLIKPLTHSVAAHLALAFLAEEWRLLPQDQARLILVKAQPTPESGYLVELGINGLPDRWTVQVHATGECEPNYGFASPLSGVGQSQDLMGLPDRLAKMVLAERQGWLMLGTYPVEIA